MISVYDVLILGGFGLIGVGAVLPWVDKQLPVKVYVLGTQSGLERIWVRRLMVLASVGVVVDIGHILMAERRAILELALIGIGCLIAAITLGTSPLTSLWTSAAGVYITLSGSLLVVIGSSIPLISRQVISHAIPLWPHRD